MKLRLILAFVFGIIWWLCIYNTMKSQIENDLKFYDKKYRPVITAEILPLGLFLGFISNMLFYGGSSSIVTFLNHCLNLIVVFSLYYVFIFIFLKLLRKYLHPLVVSSLWILPNILYFFIIYRTKFIIENVFIIHVSPILVIVLFIIWFIGFSVICIHKITEHFKYRELILKDAYEIIDEHVLELFEIEREKIEYRKIKIDLAQSDFVQTPLTIGIRNKVLVLPNKYYTDEELKLIFNHEIIHIARGDVFTKFYIVFCNACCWFNPLMWLANKKCSEDLELSCDMSVLTNVDDDKRKLYAHLILDNTTCDKGFTTCLSNDAKSLKYRLSNILHPKYKGYGGLLVFALIFAIVLSWGSLGIAIKGYNGYEELFESKKPTLTGIYVINVEYKNQVYSLEYEDKIIEYLSNLEISKLPIAQMKEEDGKIIRLYFESDKEVWLYDNYIKVETKNIEEYYYVEEGIDFNYLDQYIVSYPGLKLDTLVDGTDLGYIAWPPLKEVSVDGHIVYESVNEYMYDNFNMYVPETFKIDFYDEVVSDVEVIVETKDNIETHIIKQDELSSYEIPYKFAKYTIKASTIVNGITYDVVYGFERIDYQEVIGE